MANAFTQVPSWGSWENQGAGIAVADLDGDGRPEIFVLRIDHPTPGPNAAFYRVGQSLDAGGNVAAWGPWIEIPNWLANENQGGGLAVADLDNDGRPELIVFRVDKVVPGPNAGWFRVGRKLDAVGNVTGGWSAWQQVPDWQSWDNQGATIAVADLNGDGQPELIVLRIDNFRAGDPAHRNRGFYSVGMGLQASGQISGVWGPWMEIDWFSRLNQGAGLAVTDLDNNGRPELVVFQIDNPTGENGGFLRIGWNLDPTGKVQEGWGAWTRVDGWGSWEDQGGGLAIASFTGGPPQAVVLHADNPPALNAGLFTVLPLALDIDQAKDKGIWRVLPYLSEVLPVHAALLHTGKVLLFAGSGNNAVRFASPLFGNEPQKVYTSVVWDFVNNSFDHPPTLHQADGRPVDFFCCGHCFLPDGKLLAAGGTDKYDFDGHMVPTGKGFLGRHDAAIFDPINNQWSAIARMGNGRWYPTLVMLNDGTALATAGLDEFGSANRDANNTTLEKNSDPAHAAWKKARDFKLPLYPHLFLMKDGRLFFTGGKMDSEGDSQPFLFDPLLPTPSQKVDNLKDPGKCNQGASVILPPAQNQQVMILGGGPEDQDGQPRQPATKRVNIADLSAANPRYEVTGDLNLERMHVNAVLLPDRTVLATGGGVTREASNVAGNVNPQQFSERFEAEIYDPSTKKWVLTAKATVARLYHSVALLLPDGRVLTAGGNPDKGRQIDWLPPDPLEEMRLEIFSPPYLFKTPRPQILVAPTNLAYGAVFTITTPQAAQIKWISLIRPSLTTHSFNGEQRLVDVPFQPSATGLQATLTNDRNLAPPGLYMLFLTDIKGIPSIANWVRVA